MSFSIDKHYLLLSIHGDEALMEGLYLFMPSVRCWCLSVQEEKSVNGLERVSLKFTPDVDVLKNLIPL